MSDALLQFLDAETRIDLAELLRASGLAHDEVAELVAYGVFEVQGEAQEWTFTSRSIVLGRRAARLRSDFGLNASGMALALTYLERIEALERRIRELECGLLR
jgi:chaperone modulatory protein CbpM